ncbi:MAG TPA: PadR family transcriptional regulator [Terriglobales bacterium]|jgi:DNA-binding PadR family transcriptional regulator|nr:PadR family transcriptional regulator [Terriglobales bacterium]
MTDLIILATLLPGPKHGYSIKRQAGLILGQEKLHNNLVYPLLRRFMTKKWVTKKEVPGERGQTRQLYSITPLGRKELISQLSNFTEQDARASDQFRFRVGMFQVIEPEARMRILDTRERYLNSRIEKLSAIQDNFDLDLYSGEVTRRLRGESRAELDWIAHLRRISK